MICSEPNGSNIGVWRGEEPRHHLALSRPPPPFPLAHADQLINSVLKKLSQTKGL